MLVELSEIMSPAELYRTRSLELLLFAPCGSDCTHPVLDLKCARCPTVAPVCKLYVYLDLRGAEAIHIPLCAPCAEVRWELKARVDAILSEFDDV